MKVDNRWDALSEGVLNKLVCVKQSILEGRHAFSYDNRNQLVGAVYPDGSSEEFAYDLVGNRTSLVAVSTNGTTNTIFYTYASGNRLVADASETATNAYAYDGAGRLTNHVVNGQPRTSTYNFQGRMISLTDIDGSVFAYEFDGEGNRLSQSLNDCLSKRFVYDGADVLLELNPTNGVAYAWVNGPGIDQPIERLLFIDGPPRARRVFHADALGSIAALTDPNGLVTQTYAYAAFGSLRSSTGPDLNRVTYTGREQLGNSPSLMYCRYRIYSTHFGRFTTQDPLGFYAGVNKWIYGANNSMLFIDPFGLQACSQDSCFDGDVWHNTGIYRDEKLLLQNAWLAREISQPNAFPFNALGVGLPCDDYTVAVLALYQVFMDLFGSKFKRHYTSDDLLWSPVRPRRFP